MNCTRLIRIQPQTYRLVVRPIGLLVTYLLASLILVSMLFPLDVSALNAISQAMFMTCALMAGMPAVCMAWFRGPDGMLKYFRVFCMFQSALLILVSAFGVFFLLCTDIAYGSLASYFRPGVVIAVVCGIIGFAVMRSMVSYGWKGGIAKGSGSERASLKFACVRIVKSSQ